METGESIRAFSFLTPKGKRVTLEMREGVKNPSLIVRNMAAAGLAEGNALLSDYRAGVSAERDNEFLQKSAVMHGFSLSLLLRPAVHARNATLLSAMAAVAFARALERVSGGECKIRWVDDIYVGREKIAVTESSCSLRQDGYLNYLVLTVSARLPKRIFPEGLSDIVNEVFSGKANSLSARIAKCFLEAFFPMYESLSFDRSFIEEYKTRCNLIGRHALLLRDGRRRRVTVLGVDDNACLLVETSKKEVLSLSSRSEIYLP